ncbi:MAG TPA: hypothetical protein VNA15_10710 [Candidatus Angelobacter sp.]|nr:hypothetical protein [Candidatus Angelobacter sp.]
MSAVAGVFWGTMAIAFALLSCRTYKLRRVNLPRQMKDATRMDAFTGANIGALLPVFREILIADLIAFGLTFAASVF